MTVEAIKSAIQELSPPDRQKLANWFEEMKNGVHQLRQQAQTERISALRRTSGILTLQEADAWMKAIEDCERIDESTW